MSGFDDVDDEASAESEANGRESGIARGEPSADSEPNHEGVIELDLVRERDELRALAQRVQADFENFRKRVQREQSESATRGAALLVEQLLPVLDNFELALLNLEDADDRVRKGVELAYADLVAVLERVGLERIPTDGTPFDPEVHEAVMHDAGEGEPTVVETMRPGYRLKGRVLRPAMVKVAG